MMTPLTTTSLAEHFAAEIRSRPTTAGTALSGTALSGTALPGSDASPGEDESSPQLRKVFDDFIGQTFYGQMCASLRKGLNKPAYFHGGRAEEVFQGQLDQVLVEKLSDATAGQFSGPMFDLFNLNRKM